MLWPLIGPRLHAWLDDLVVAVYLVGAWALGLTGAALVVAIAAGAVHFTLTRLTSYPHRRAKLIAFPVHAFIELGEGLAVLAAAVALAPGPSPVFAAAAALAPAPSSARVFLALMGAAQLGAFSFSDYRGRVTAA